VPGLFFAMSAVNVIIVAGGTGRRFGGDVPKQFVALRGEALLVWSARRFVGVPDLTCLIVVAPPDQFGRCEALLAPLGVPVRLATAGAERQDSVRAGVALLEPTCEIALVHDAARPLVTPAAITACLAAAREVGAAILATPVSDTVKRVSDGRIVATVPRGDLWLAQTPQGFRAADLRRVHADAARANFRGTDDAALFEWAGLRVAIVPGDVTNRKITTPDDLAWAEAVLARVPGVQS
jgi:2-C-methyl-D-erythritol 4-phosphate cytidylyltransferase